ncbi:thioesterase family protein [Azospirillum sp. SYSU D00513]|uniref:acyl-CoA thioesterase n=1 Tax=Azospirillum sp. SYSU D00513 TaxID=2812561 RepID=UPI001A97AE56|nr:thioesterase family protein [Azospirillum sp. SYSU D00513]
MTDTTDRKTPDGAGPDLTDPEGYRFWVDEHVRFADLDPLGHVNNNAIGVYFEQARVVLLTAGLGLRRESPWTVVIARSLIEYKAELHYPAEVRIGARVLRAGNSSLTLGSAIFQGDRCIATQEAVLVIVDKAAHRPTPIPDAVRPVLDRYS